MITEDNPHTERLGYCQIAFWQGNAACGKLDAWDHAEIMSPSALTRISFTREQERQMRATVDLMEEAAAYGRRDKAREVRKALGVK